MIKPKPIQPIVSRPIRTPDGMVHIVALQEGWWKCLDWMIARGETLEDITGFCWRHLQENPQDEFAAVFEYYLHRYMTDYRAALDSLANENFYDPDLLSETST